MLDLDVRREDQDPDLRVRGPDRPCRVEPLQMLRGRHADVDHHEIRDLLAHACSPSAVASPACPTTSKPAPAQQARDPLAQQDIVLGDDDSTRRHLARQLTWLGSCNCRTLARLADEQAALHRVATLVANGVEPEPLFDALAGEVEALFGADISARGQVRGRRHRHRDGGARRASQPRRPPRSSIRTTSSRPCSGRARPRASTSTSTSRRPSRGTGRCAPRAPLP